MKQRQSLPSEEFRILLGVYVGAYLGRAKASGEAGTLKDLAEQKLYCDRATLYRWLKGETSPSTEDLHRLCNIIGVPTSQIGVLSDLLAGKSSSQFAQPLLVSSQSSTPYLIARPPYERLVVPAVYPLIIPVDARPTASITLCTIGRNPALNTMVVLEPPTVSREHASVSGDYHQNNWVFFIHPNVNSKNPTFLNGSEINEPQPLSEGSVIKLSRYGIELTFSDDLLLSTTLPDEACLEKE
jgi:transcriptional regulator with XRE-family HTH domain